VGAIGANSQFGTFVAVRVGDLGGVLIKCAAISAVGATRTTYAHCE
jgi:hypothetical protein